LGIFNSLDAALNPPILFYDGASKGCLFAQLVRNILPKLHLFFWTIDKYVAVVLRELNLESEFVWIFTPAKNLFPPGPRCLQISKIL
jgi:hypothetical protein